MNRIVKLLLPLPILLSPAIALAGTKTSLDASLTSGSLTVSAPSVKSSFTGIILNGKVQKSYSTLSDWSVTDATGTGNGWTVDLSASQLTEIAPSGGFTSGTTALTLPSGSLSLAGTRTITSSSGSTPVSTTGGPLFENATSVIDSGSPVEIVKSNTNYGLGQYTVNEPTNGLELTLQPSSVKVDNVNYPSSPTPYESTLTYTVASAPVSVKSYPVPSGMQGVGIPIGSTATASNSYSTSPIYAFNGTTTEWVASGYTTTIQADFPSPITFSGVQIATQASPSTNEQYTIFGKQNGSWVQIGSATRYVSGNSFTVLSPVSVTAGSYSGIKFEINGGSSWADLDDVTLIK